MKTLSDADMEDKRMKIASFSVEKTKSFVRSLHSALLDPKQKEELLSLCEEKISSCRRSEALVEVSSSI